MILVLALVSLIFLTSRLTSLHCINDDYFAVYTSAASGCMNSHIHSDTAIGFHMRFYTIYLKLCYSRWKLTTDSFNVNTRKRGRTATQRQPSLKMQQNDKFYIKQTNAKTRKQTTPTTTRKQTKGLAHNVVVFLHCAFSNIPHVV